MPAALLLARPSGLYCRLLVPLSLRAILGKRYIVRSLRTCDRDKARLVAALIALEARAVFAALTRGDEKSMDDIKKRRMPRSLPPKCFS